MQNPDCPEAGEMVNRATTVPFAQLIIRGCEVDLSLTSPPTPPSHS